MRSMTEGEAPRRRTPAPSVRCFAAATFPSRGRTTRSGAEVSSPPLKRIKIPAQGQDARQRIERGLGLIHQIRIGQIGGR